MSHNDLGLVISLFVFIVTAFLLIYMIYNGGLKQCAKKHNVYNCEYVAVPKKEGE